MRKFIRNRRGNVASTAGVLAVPLLFTAGISTDYAMMVNIEKKLQAAADAAALAGAKELSLSNTSDSVIREIAKNQVIALMDMVPEHEVNIGTSITDNRKDVTVDLDYIWQPLIIQYVNSEALPIKASATGSIASSEAVCVIALDNSLPSTLALTGVSSVETVGCSVYSNSVSNTGISAVKDATLKSPTTYSSGGYTGPFSSFLPTPVTDSTPIPDPLSSRQPPNATGCDFTNVSIPKGNATLTLKPGVYCGGISLNSKTTIELDPGIYVMKDGPLSISGNATIKGENVGFYFTGTASTLNFGVSTQAILTAPASGPMAGILFFEDRSSPLGREFMIRSKDAEKFEGTVYLPRGKFVLDKASRVGQASKWTAIIARQIEIREGPQLRINSDYAGSPIPVPEGIGPNSPPRLKF